MKKLKIIILLLLGVCVIESRASDPKKVFYAVYEDKLLSRSLDLLRIAEKCCSGLKVSNENWVYAAAMG